MSQIIVRWETAVDRIGEVSDASNLGSLSSLAEAASLAQCFESVAPTLIWNVQRL